MPRCSFRRLGIARASLPAASTRSEARAVAARPRRQSSGWNRRRRPSRRREGRGADLRTEQLEQRRLLAIDVTNVTSSAVDGFYNVGDTIDISVTFSGPVGKVTGVPQLRLASGSNAFAQFNPTATGSFPTSTLKFTYTIQAEENAADLDYATVNALELGSGGVLDQFGVPAQLTLPVPGAVKSLGWNKNLVVDTKAPAASLTLTKTAVGNENNSATLNITLSEPSTDFTLNDITATDQGTGKTLDNAVVFTNFIGSGRNYSVVFTPPAAFVGTVLFDIPAGSFTDAAGNFNVVMPGSGAQLYVNTNAPVVRSVTSSTANGVFNAAGDPIDIQVEFSTPVAVGSLGPQGNPFLELNSGNGARAEWVSAVGSVVTFRYTVADGDEARDLDYRSIDALKGGYILRLDTGTQALRTLPEPGGSGSLAANKNLVVDTRGPAITITSSRYVLGANQVAKITFTLSEPADPVSSFALADVQSSNAAAGDFVSATWSPSSDGRSYSVDFVPRTSYTGSVIFSVNPGAFKDGAGNDNSFASIAQAISVNTASPNQPVVTPLVTKVGSPVIQGTTGTTGLQANQRLIIEVGGGTYDNRSGSSGVRVAGTTWSLDLANAAPILGTKWTAPATPAVDIYEVIATIVDDSGNERQDASQNELTIDTVVPRVLSVTSTTANGVYGVGKTISISVTFSEIVTVAPSGTPTLLLNSGNGARAIYTSGTGTNKLVFTYTVGSGEATPDLDYLDPSALRLNGSTIRDDAKNDADITLAAPGGAGSLGSAAQIEIETVAPSATMTSSKATLKKSETAVITVTFSEPPLTPAPTLSVLPTTAGSVTALAGTADPKIWTAVFTPATNFEGMANFSLGAYTDRAGNIGSTTSLATPIQIDTKSPTVTISTSPTPGNTLNSTGIVTAIFTWSEPVTFSADKVALANLSLVTGSWSQAGNVYTASYVPTSSFSGTGTIAVPLGAATDALGNPSDAMAPVSFPIDTIAPTALQVTSPDANGTYGVGKTITIQVSFSEAVTVAGGVPYLLLNAGNGARANYTSGSGTSTLTFRYTVGAGENSSDLDYGSPTALQLPSGTTIRDAAGNSAVLTLVAPGSAGSLGSSSAIVIETSQPTASIAVNKSVVKKGETATITVTFVKPPVASTLKALTVTPSAAGTLGSLSATGPNVYTAVFTPSANFEGTAVFNLLGDYEDAGGNKGLPASSSPVTVDTKSPTVTIATSPSAGSVLIAGGTVTATFTWNEDVTFSDDKVMLGNLTLVPGSFGPVSPGNKMIYRGSYAPPTSFAGSGSIAVPLGAATDGVGNISDASAASNFQIDTVVPTISSVRQASTTINGTYGLAKDIFIEVVFSEPVTVNGVPSLYLNAGNGARATFASGSGTNILTFKYTVGGGEASQDLDYTSTSALWLNGGSIRDANSNNAVLTLPAPGATGSLGSNAQIVIETTAPTATMTSSSYRLKKGEKATLTVTFSERPLAVPSLTVTPANGGPTSTLVLTQVGSNSSVYAAEFTPAANYAGGVNMTLPGTYTDAAGNIGSSASLPQLIQVDTASPVCQVTTDIAAGTTLTRTSAVRVTFTWSEPVPFPSANAQTQNLNLVSWTDVGGLNTTYVAIYTPKQDFEGSGSLTVPAGAVVDSFGNPSESPVSLTWPIDTLSPGVDITATPISIASGGLSEVFVKFSSVPTGFTVDDLLITMNGSAQGSFNGSFGPTSDPTIWKGTFSAGGGDGSANFKVLAGAFTDAKGNPNVAGDEVTILIDTIAPKVLSVSAAAGAYNAEDEILIKVVFTESLPNIASEPVLGIPLTTGGIAEWFATDPADVSGRTQLFRYVVVDGDNADPLDYLDGSITGGPVTDAVGNEADLALPVPGGPGSLATSLVTIDTAVPTIVSVSANRSNLALKADGVVRIDVVFSEALPYTTATLPAMSLELAGGGTATSWAMINDRTVRFRYVVQSGENANPLDFESSSALAASGALLDKAGNPANLTLPTPGGPGSLSSFKIVIDTVAPAVDDVTVVTPPGAYKAGDVLTFKVTFSEKILVVGTPTLKLALAGNKYATFDRVEGDKSAIFTYTVQAGDSTEKLDYDGPTALSGVITDVASNPASLSLPMPGLRGSISDDQSIVIDTTPPAVKPNGLSPLSGPGTYGINSMIRFTVTMTEPVTASGQVQVLLNTIPARYADLVSSDGTTLTFEYRPRIGDRAMNLNHASSMALTGTIVDRAGNPANLTLPAPIPPGSFGGPGVIAIDARIGVLSTSPVLSLTASGPIFYAPLTTIDIVFTTPVTGVSLAGIKLFFQERSVSLTGASITGNGTTYRLTLPRLATSLNGSYRLRIGGGASGISADSGDGMMVPMSTPVNLYWRKAKRA